MTDLDNGGPGNTRVAATNAMLSSRNIEGQYGNWDFVVSPESEASTANNAADDLSSKFSSSVACIQRLRKNSSDPTQKISVAQLEETVTTATASFSSRSIPLRRFQYDILIEAVVPYLVNIEGRTSAFAVFSKVDPTRYDQVDYLIKLLYLNNASRAGLETHPSIVLNEIETMIASIRAKSHLFPSQLQTSLEKAVDKQWRPMVTYASDTLNHAATNLVVLGLLELFGRQLVMLAVPAYISSDLLVAVYHDYRKLEAMRSHNIADYFPIAAKCFKLAVLVGILSKVVAIVSLYKELGHLALLLGAAGFVVASQDHWLKEFVLPRFHRQLGFLSNGLVAVTEMERRALEGMNGLTQSIGGSSGNTATNTANSSTAGVSHTSPGLRQRR